MEELVGGGSSPEGMKELVGGGSSPEGIVSPASTDFADTFRNHIRTVVGNVPQPAVRNVINSAPKRRRSSRPRVFVSPYHLRSKEKRRQHADRCVESIWRHIRAKHLNPKIAISEVSSSARGMTYQKKEKIHRTCAETALKSFNESEEAKKVGEFELVEVKDISGLDSGATVYWYRNTGFWYHINFVAKSKNGPNDLESKLFFAELNLGGGLPSTIECLKCCILGPLDIGYSVCEACLKCCSNLRHPLDG